MMPGPDALPIFEELQSLYRRSAGAVRAQFDHREEAARQYYARYLHFVARSAGPGQAGALLEVGCGADWSTYFFARIGWHAVGIDVNSSAFEPPSLVNLSLLQASAVALPFPDAVFEVVMPIKLWSTFPTRGRLCRRWFGSADPAG
jgi:SAM-dependent methyltransferase